MIGRRTQRRRSIAVDFNDSVGEVLRSLLREVVPTITLEGDANGAPHPDASAYAKMF